ncbi:ROK family protein (plasmid) [Rhizobium sp. T1470]|uniref:ROK family protein n=1 Tax=unclassified Rhizobium TaxID=2613769 RepID=UPI001AAF09FB|nr:ROK family protein [Rhizobium sp. T1473]MCA0806047.1 ROK family protein [Rhizobium sp. T1473]
MDSMIKRLENQRIGESSDASNNCCKIDGAKRMPAQKLISTGTLGPANRGRLLQALYDMGATSRADLARFTGVNRATIGGIVQPLINQGILAEGEVVPPNEAGGKPATRLWFSKNARPICAVLLMHNRVRTCLVSLDGEIYAQRATDFPTDLADASDAFRIVSTCVEETIASANLPILGIGVAVAGMINTETGSIVNVSLAPYLDGFPVGPELSKRFGVHVCVDQDTRAFRVGDRWFGQGRGRRTFAAVYIGEALGGALYLNGHLYRGSAGAGGEIGHTTVQLHGHVCQCGRRGCWETIASLRWLRDEAKARGVPKPHMLNAGRLVTLAGGGVKGAKELLQQYAFNISVGLANLQQLMAPDCIVLHGDIVLGGKTMLNLIEGSFRELVFHRPGEEIALAFGDSEDVAALRGAACLFLSELLNFVI